MTMPIDMLKRPKISVIAVISLMLVGQYWLAEFVSLRSTQQLSRDRSCPLSPVHCPLSYVAWRLLSVVCRRCVVVSLVIRLYFMFCGSDFAVSRWCWMMLVVYAPFGQRHNHPPPTRSIEDPWDSLKSLSPEKACLHCFMAKAYKLCGKSVKMLSSCSRCSWCPWCCCCFIVDLICWLCCRPFVCLPIVVPPDIYLFTMETNICSTQKHADKHISGDTSFDYSYFSP